ncbi:hypothetical protein Leryth_017734 [Lithospermum erythrorhizon]|nr:hypothetical protein Leryth_017734 [Lithospermum erythrorhizon]
MEVENGGNKEVVVANKRSFRCSDLVLRFLALALTLVAAIVLGVNKETKNVSMEILPKLPPLTVPVTAKWHYLSAFVYLVVADSIACAYAAISLVITLANRGNKKGLTLLIMISDLIMVGLLFSGGGAATSVGLIGYEGNTHLRWNKVCNIFDRYCHQVAASLFLSLLGATIFLVMVSLSTLNLAKKH